jgi:hypothetical protein
MCKDECLSRGEDWGEERKEDRECRWASRRKRESCTDKAMAKRKTNGRTEREGQAEPK